MTYEITTTTIYTNTNISTSTTFTTTLNFSNNNRMDYSAGRVDMFVNKNILISVTSDEFDGEEENEVVITTSKIIPTSSLKKMLAHFEPSKQQINIAE